MAWADDLPRIRAENEAWREKHLPGLKAAEAEKAARRNRVRVLIESGLTAIGATNEQRAEVFALTGFGAAVNPESNNG